LSGSARVAAAGAGLAFGGLLALLAVMPRVTPFELRRCFPGSQCFSSVNPDYPLVFLLSVAGTVLLFLGLFGRGFVLNPVFVAGMIALEYGLAGVVSAALDAEREAAGGPVVFAPLVAIGALAIAFQTSRRLRRGTRPRAGSGIP
jgi:hypothetical protein